MGYAPAPVPRTASTAAAFAPVEEGAAPVPVEEAAAPAPVEPAAAPAPAPTVVEVAAPSAEAAPASTDRRNPLSRRLPINRGRHLSRKFFEEGERQQEAGWEHSPLAADLGSPDAGIKFRSFDHVPKRRAPLVVVAMLGVAGIGTLVVWGSGGWSPRVLGKSDIGLTLFLLGAGAPSPSTSTSTSTSASASTSPAPVASSQRLEGSRAALVATANAPSVSPTLGSRGVVTTPTPSPTLALPSTPPAIVPRVRAGAAAAPRAVPAARRSLGPSRRKASRGEHVRPGAPSRARQKQAAAAAALQGEVWSADREQLVSSESPAPSVEEATEEPEVPAAAASETF